MPNAIITLKRLTLFCSILLSYFSSFAQTTRVDDLLGQLNKANTDSAQIAIMRKLSAAYSAVDPVKKYFYANQYRILAEKNNIDSSVANAFLDMGISHGIRSNVDSALYFFKLGFKKAKESNYINGIARSYANIGYAYDRLERKKEAVKNYEESLKIYRKLNYKKGISQNIINLGSIYFDLEEYNTAHKYFLEVLEHVKENPKDEIGLGNALFSLGNSNRKLGNLKRSMAYYKQSLAIREKIGDISGIALSNWGIGEIYHSEKNYNKAEQYLKLALKKNEAVKNPYQETAILLSLGHNYLALKKHKEAEKIGQLALDKSIESKSKGLTSHALKLLVEISTAQSKFEEALKLQTNYIEVKDSLNNNKVKEDVIINDLHRINSDNKNLQQSNKQIIAKNSDYAIAIGIITFLLTVVIVLLVLYYKRNAEKKASNLQLQKQKQEVAEVNEELNALNEELLKQMNIVSSQNIELEKLNAIKNKFFSIVSHDLRSPLNNLKMLFELYHKGELNKEELNDLLVKLGDTIYNTAGFLDNLLEWAKNQLEGININPENFSLLTIVKENLNLVDSQLRAKNIIIENSIVNDINVYADPNMINIVIRNILSNAVKFCTADDLISFDAKIVGNEILLRIRDTGRGMDEETKNNLFTLSHQTSIGTSGEKGYQIGLILCKDMIMQNGGKITVDSELGEGTTFLINLPLGKG
jgi:two-component system sensor histidine kinase/response regulator